MHSAEVALEAWALLQPEAVSAPEPELAASLPNVVDRLHHGDSIQEETLLALSRSCPLPARRAEAPLITLRRSLEQSRAKGGDVQFLSFWRTLGEAARQSDVGGPATPTLPPSCRLPHLSPLSEASPGLTTPRCGNVMEELEELRDALLDRFEEVGDRLSLVAFQDEVRSMQKRSSTPAFWAEVLEAHSEGGPGSLSISEVTVLLLALLRDAAAWQLTLSPSHLHTGFATLPQNGEGGQAEDLSILAKHLRQALDTDTSPQDLSRPLWTSSVTGCETCTGGYVAAESPSAPRRHLRSAMLSLQDEADDSPGGWMRTAMLPLRGPCADEAAELRDTPREAADGTLDSNATIPMPLLSDPGLRRTAAAAVLNEDASQAEHNTGDWLEGWKGQRIWARSAMLPVSTLPSLEPVDASAKLGMPVLLHIYDVTQERGIRRLNKVLANKRLPIKFGGVFHAGVEVDGREWSYGCTESEDDPGVLANKPKMHPDHHYRQTVNMSQTPLSAGEICKLLQELTTEYPGPEYDLLRRNCCHFADDFCRRLGVGRIPSWVHRLARIAARIETILQAAQRIRN
ncbi:unnamed protein product [Effrenium voratum]|uniref:PPPDE domain-containing protein n=1 Tax=Effrenium voratum TaxID=2562239 RepID=A0AA36JM51_9DINO|nr:unnamed protein product [Effrenium voratum]